MSFSPEFLDAMGAGLYDVGGWPPTANCYNPRPLMAKKTIVHVVGTGTIGEPLIGMYLKYREPWGIDEVTFHKRTPAANDRAMVEHLINRGGKLLADEGARDEFAQLRHRVPYTTAEAPARSPV